MAITLAVFLFGCGGTPQAPVLLNKQSFFAKENPARVGVIFETEQPTTHIYGASCLLCYGVASAANSSLSTHLEGIPLDDINAIKGFTTSYLEGQGKEVKVIELKKKLKKLPSFKKSPGFPDKDFRKLKDVHGIDHLIVIHLPEHGAYRSYNAYIATSDPLGAVLGKVFTIDLNTNQYLQYAEINQKVAVNGAWDEPPSFPGVTTAYYEAIEKTKETIKTLF